MSSGNIGLFRAEARFACGTSSPRVRVLWDIDTPTLTGSVLGPDSCTGTDTEALLPAWMYGTPMLIDGPFRVTTCSINYKDLISPLPRDATGIPDLHQSCPAQTGVSCFMQLQELGQFTDSREHSLGTRDSAWVKTHEISALLPCELTI